MRPDLLGNVGTDDLAGEGAFAFEPRLIQIDQSLQGPRACKQLIGDLEVIFNLVFELSRPLLPYIWY